MSTTAEAEDAVTTMLSSVFEQPASVHHDLVRDMTWAQVFLPAGRKACRADLAEIRAELKELRGCGIDVGQGRLLLKRIQQEDWAQSWKRHFKPLEFGDALLVKPSWSKRRPRPGQAVVVLDPGLSFGTGQHATTSFCLRVLVRCAVRAKTRGECMSFLDVGTGSGILAIAAAKLGGAPVHGFDFDPDAVRIARENARRNRVAPRVRLSQADLTKISRTSNVRYDVVCANLMADLLIDEHARILARLKCDGVLVLAGILDSQFSAVRICYEAAGLRLVRSRREKEWRSGLFVRG